MPKKIRKKFQIHKALIAILPLVALIVVFIVFQKPVKQQVSAVPDLSTAGFIKIDSVTAEIANNSGVVTLRGGCFAVTAFTDTVQAESIMNGLAGVVKERPGTHDVIKDAFKNLGIEVVMVKIVDIKNNNFIGRLILKQGNSILSLDSRPSDGIALAVRTNSSIYFKADLMQQYGRNIC
jgi:bifunctional DNase/RNase